MRASHSITGKRYDELTPEQIDREKTRKRLVNRRQWVDKWWPRIEAETRKEASNGTHGNHS